MKKIFFIFYFLFLFSIVSSGTVETLGTFKLDECVQLKQICDNCTEINFTEVTYPNGSQALGNVESEKNGVVFNYTFCYTNSIGEYLVYGVGDLDGEDTIFTYNFFITPTGYVNNGWTISIQIFASLSTLFLTLLFLFLSRTGADSNMTKGESGSYKFLFMGLALVFLTAHIIITNSIIHDTLGVDSSMASSYTHVMYVFFTILILIFMYTLIKVIFWEMDIFFRKKGLK